MTNSGNLFAHELTEWLPEAGFIQYQYHMSMFYKHASYGLKKISFLMLMTVYIGIPLSIL